MLYGDLYKRFFKRFLDILFSVVVLLVASPFLFLLAIGVISSMGFPVFFSQERIGKNEKLFKVIKFRSMSNRRDANGNLLSNKDRLTRFGAFLRKCSLDELPQLLNVIKGDMSLIGPRPLFVKYLSYYTDNEKKRHDVRPGITGWAQINGRNHLDWESRLAMDVYYVDHLSFRFDVKIFFSTIVKVLRGGDVVVALDPLINVPLDEYRKNSVKKT